MRQGVRREKGPIMHRPRMAIGTIHLLHGISAILGASIRLLKHPSVNGFDDGIIGLAPSMRLKVAVGWPRGLISQLHLKCRLIIGSAGLSAHLNGGAELWLVITTKLPELRLVAPHPLCCVESLRNYVT